MGMDGHARRAGFSERPPLSGDGTTYCGAIQPREGNECLLFPLLIPSPNIVKITHQVRFGNRKGAAKVSGWYLWLRTWVVKTQMSLHYGNSHCPESQ